MNNEEILKQLKENREEIAKIYISVEKTRKYIMWTAVVTAVLFFLPLIALMFAIPSYVNQMSGLMEGI